MVCETLWRVILSNTKDPVIPDYFIFVPAYNVEKTLCEVLSRIDESVLARAHVLVIDDGSRDGTALAFQKFIESDYLNVPVNVECDDDFGSSQNAERAKVLRNHFEYLKFEQNSGYGAVVKKGIAAGRQPIYFVFSKKVLDGTKKKG